MRKLTLVALAALFISTPPGARAQEPLHWSFEGRLGFLHSPTTRFLGSPEGNHFSGGVLASYRPNVTPDVVLNRITGRFSFERTGLGTQDLISGLQTTERLWLTNFAAGFDVLQLPTLNVIVHGGGAIARDTFVIRALDSSGRFVDACSSFSGFCDSNWDFLGNEGVEARFTPVPSWSFFFAGADYTHYAGGRDQLIFLGGFSF